MSSAEGRTEEEADTEKDHNRLPMDVSNRFLLTKNASLRCIVVRLP